MQSSNAHVFENFEGVMAEVLGEPLALVTVKEKVQVRVQVPGKE